MAAAKLQVRIFQWTREGAADILRFSRGQTSRSNGEKALTPLIYALLAAKILGKGTPRIFGHALIGHS